MRTVDGATYTPSLSESASNRPLKRDQVEADANWEYVGVPAEGDLGTDPAIIRDVNNGGMVGVVVQVSDDSLPRGAVITEFFNNWLPAILIASAIDADGKTASTWAALKAGRETLVQSYLRRARPGVVGLSTRTPATTPSAVDGEQRTANRATLDTRAGNC